MDALLLALILTLLLDQGAATQSLVARFGEAGRGGAGLALMVAINAVVAAAMGGLIAALLTGEALLLFLSIALFFGAIGQMAAPFRSGSAKRLDGAPLRSLVHFALRRAGENGAFAVAGVAAFTGAPVLAAVGAMLGGWTALIPALALGSRYVRSEALRILQPVSGLILLCVAIWCAASALRLI
jgi:putative Ca2+/H+ antiporter (TMEM165/GDT1 family)